MYELSKAAVRDLDDILDYTLNKHDPARAETYFAGLKAKFELLADRPLLSRERNEFTPSVHIHHHAYHLIVYTVQDDGGIFVVRVLHERMDVEQHLHLKTDIKDRY